MLDDVDDEAPSTGRVLLMINSDRGGGLNPGGALFSASESCSLLSLSFPLLFVEMLVSRRVRLLEPPSPSPLLLLLLVLLLVAGAEVLWFELEAIVLAILLLAVLRVLFRVSGRFGALEALRVVKEATWFTDPAAVALLVLDRVGDVRRALVPLLGAGAGVVDDSTSEDIAAAARAATADVDVEVEAEAEIFEALEEAVDKVLLLLPKRFRPMPALVAGGTRTLMARAAGVLFRTGPPMLRPAMLALVEVGELVIRGGESMSGRC